MNAVPCTPEYHAFLFQPSRSRELPLRRHTRRLRGRDAVINSQLPPVQLLPLQELHRLDRAVDVDEVGVGETPRLSRAAINRYPDVDDVAHLAEQVAEVLVRHLEGHVADEEGLGGWVDAGLLAAVDGRAWAVELHGETATLEDLLVGGFDCLGGVVDALEFDVAETGGEYVSIGSQSWEMDDVNTYPLLRPRPS